MTPSWLTLKDTGGGHNGWCTYTLVAFVITLLCSTRVAATASADTGARCVDDADCSLLGICSADAVCVCDPGWMGDDCAVANLANYNASQGGYINATAASWGGRPLLVNGKWQLFATEIAARCPLILFMNNSMVIRAESTTDSAAGPYVHKDIVRAPFAHNPTAVGPTPDGYYLIYSIGGAAANSSEPTPPSWHLDCTSKLPSCAEKNCCRAHGTPDSNGQIVMSWTKDPEAGPWSHRVVLPIGVGSTGSPTDWNCKHNNPSAIINATDGSVKLMFHGSSCIKTAGERLGLADAKHWNDTTYTNRPGPPIIAPTNGTGSHEDPFMWMDKRGNYHTVTHNQGDGNVCGAAAQGSMCGAHLFSRDSYAWKISKSAVYTKVVSNETGKADLQTRQRPQIVFSDDGEVRPLYLFNAASFQGNNNDLHMLTHTMLFEFQ
eukprot:m.249741 g.249741  ORF g.249741 m.249741 type:complete len:434 (-) comp33878_c0_seq4:4396-5697(-)